MVVHVPTIIITEPTAPRNLVPMEPDVTGNIFNITLTWSRPDPPNGLITLYNVSDVTNRWLLALTMCIVIGILQCYRLTK